MHPRHLTSSLLKQCRTEHPGGVNLYTFQDVIKTNLKIRIAGSKVYTFFGVLNDIIKNSFRKVGPIYSPTSSV